MRIVFKRHLSLILSLLMVFTIMQSFNSFSYGAETEGSKYKYHLDIGVIVAIKYNEKWISPAKLRTYYPLKTKITFPKEVKVNRIMTVKQAEDEGILWNNPNLTHNILPSLEGSDLKEKFIQNYKGSSPEFTLEHKIVKGEGKTIEFSQKAFLNIYWNIYDLMEIYREKVVKSKKQNKDEFADYVCKFWGGEAGLKAENFKMWEMVQAIKNGKPPLDSNYYLIFVPTVIEYEEKEDVPQMPPADGGVPIETVELPTGGCSDKIKWTETQSHTYSCGKNCTATCNHKYTYEATLTSIGALKSEKPNGGATLLKSGYGFSVVLNNSITVKQTANSGSCGQYKTKAYTAKVRVPQSAEVRTNWIVKNEKLKTTQGKIVALEKSSESGLKSSFITAKNKVSHHKNRQIYTDVALKGTKTKPVKHAVTVYTYGGGVGTKPFCKEISLEFTVNGNMYEDDATTDRNYNSKSTK